MISSERDCYVALASLVNPPDISINQLVSEYSASHTWQRLVAGKIKYHSKLTNRAQTYSPATNSHEYTVITPIDNRWPSKLNDLLDEAPLALWIRGESDLRSLTLNSVAIVGSRAATRYGLQVTQDLSAYLVNHQICVVSGAAYGIDAQAHRTAIAESGSTVAVIASGIDLDYPKDHEGLFRKIATSGSVITELPPGTAISRNRFLTRNRVIAALSEKTVVVEAPNRSGALNTANWANQLGRLTYGVPGPINSLLSSGVNSRIATGELKALAKKEQLLAS